VGDQERTAKVEQLLLRFSEATARQAALMSEMRAFAAKIGEVRAELGNPFFYSGARHGRPQNADKTVEKYTGYKSHEPGLTLLLGFRDVNRELTTLREQVRELGLSVE
jgi:hypothetical protein